MLFITLLYTNLPTKKNWFNGITKLYDYIFGFIN